MLTHLNLSGNRLKQLGGIDKLWALKSLNISKNEFNNLNLLEPLQRLPDLTELQIHNNPWANVMI